MGIKNYSKLKKKDIKSQIISIGFSLFSIGFIGYLLIGVLNHYLSKYF
jgi:hypothetical protein